MTANTTTHPRSRNRLLAQLPSGEYAQLLPHLETVRFRARRSLVRPGASPPKVYFPGDGVCVISYVTRDGRTTGVALVGKEGMIDSSGLGDELSCGVSVAAMIAERDAQMIDAAIFVVDFAMVGAPTATLVPPQRVASVRSRASRARATSRRSCQRAHASRRRC